MPQKMEAARLEIGQNGDCVQVTQDYQNYNLPCGKGQALGRLQRRSSNEDRPVRTCCGHIAQKSSDENVSLTAGAPK